MCFDLNSDDGKALTNFHIISLKAFCNIYSTEAGKTFMQGEGQVKEFLNFASFSLLSTNTKIVQNAAVLAFNVLLCHRAENKDGLFTELQQLMQQTVKTQFVLPQADTDGLMTLALLQCRILYNNKKMVEFAQTSDAIKQGIVGVKLKSEVAESVKEAIEDV